MKEKQRKTAEGILFTDLYELTMAQVYFRKGLHNRTAQFDYFFRNYPDYGSHKAGYCVNAGMEWVIDWMEDSNFTSKDIEYLKSQKSPAGERVFKDDFLEWLSKEGNFSGISIKAVPEGRVVHPDEPVAVVQGPFAMAQILESSFLNHLNYQTLIATKAARIKDAGKGNLFMDFGMRRGHHKGANAGARAALIGGADFTSNTGISYTLGYPPKGTHAHSMVQAFMADGGSEVDAFRAYAEVYPDNCILLVDTVDTLNSGIPNAIKVFEDLKKKGHQPVGVRLDSGDLAYLTIETARRLNEAGFPKIKIVLSNKLDEMVLWQIITQIQKEAGKNGLDADEVIDRLVYGVGTSLITSKGDAALDGVYKLSGIQKNGKWIPAIKISETPAKIVNPGNKAVWRIYDKRGRATADLIGLEEEELDKREEIVFYHPYDPRTFRKLSKNEINQIEPLHKEILKQGRRVTNPPFIEEMRERRKKDISKLDNGVKRLINPHLYHVSITEKLNNLKQELIKKHSQ